MAPIVSRIFYGTTLPQSGNNRYTFSIDIQNAGSMEIIVIMDNNEEKPWQGFGPDNRWWWDDTDVKPKSVKYGFTQTALNGNVITIPAPLRGTFQSEKIYFSTNLNGYDAPTRVYQAGNPVSEASILQPNFSNLYALRTDCVPGNNYCYGLYLDDDHVLYGPLGNIGTVSQTITVNSEKDGWSIVSTLSAFITAHVGDMYLTWNDIDPSENIDESTNNYSQFKRTYPVEQYNFSSYTPTIVNNDIWTNPNYVYNPNPVVFTNLVDINIIAEYRNDVTYLIISIEDERFDGTLTFTIQGKSYTSIKINNTTYEIHGVIEEGVHTIEGQSTGPWEVTLLNNTVTVGKTVHVELFATHFGGFTMVGVEVDDNAFNVVNYISFQIGDTLSYNNNIAKKLVPGTYTIDVNNTAPQDLWIVKINPNPLTITVTPETSGADRINVALYASYENDKVTISKVCNNNAFPLDSFNFTIDGIEDVDSVIDIHLDPGRHDISVDNISDQELWTVWWTPNPFAVTVTDDPSADKDVNVFLTASYKDGQTTVTITASDSNFPTSSFQFSIGDDIAIDNIITKELSAGQHKIDVSENSVGWNMHWNPVPLYVLVFDQQETSTVKDVNVFLSAVYLAGATTIMVAANDPDFPKDSFEFSIDGTDAVDGIVSKVLPAGINTIDVTDNSTGWNVWWTPNPLSVTVFSNVISQSNRVDLALSAVYSNGNTVINVTSNNNAFPINTVKFHIDETFAVNGVIAKQLSVGQHVVHVVDESTGWEVWWTPNPLTVTVNSTTQETIINIAEMIPIFGLSVLFAAAIVATTK